jgi:hypothetical protein
MAVAEDIGLERQEFFHGLTPRRRIAVKIGEKRGGDAI